MRVWVWVVVVAVGLVVGCAPAGAVPSATSSAGARAGAPTAVVVATPVAGAGAVAPAGGGPVTATAAIARAEANATATAAEPRGGAPAATATRAGGREEAPGGRGTATPGATRVAQQGATPAAGPRGTPVRVGNAAAQRVVAAPGSISYAVGAGGIFRLEGTSATPIEGTPGGVELVALGDGKLVAGRGSSCMMDGSTAPLRYSRDGGRTWADAMGPTGRGFPASPRLGRGDDVFALYCAGVLWSADGGRTFVPVPPLSPPNFEPRDLALSPDGATAYVSTNSEGGTLQVYRSTKSGPTWGAAAKIDEGWGLGALAVAPDGKLYLGTARGVRVSTDRGATWQAVPRAGLEDELIEGDPAQGSLSTSDERKMRNGIGINDLVLAGRDLVAATQHGIYRLAGGRWARWSDIEGRVERLVVDDGALYATIANGVVRLPAA